MITLAAYAKVNLTLEVIGKRDDGYHDIASVLQTISLKDEVSFKLADTIKFECRDPAIGSAEFLEREVLKATNLLREESSSQKGALIRLERAGIPRAAGLGSSSSVPATVLKGLNELWALGLSNEELSKLASRIGSDTPFFICGGTVLAEGRGERITPLPSPAVSPTWLLLLKPPIAPVTDKTASMYGMLNPSHFTKGVSTQKLAGGLLRGNPLQSAALYNTFEMVAFDFFPGLSEQWQKLLRAGARGVHLAGSGPTLFTLVSDKAEGETLAGRLWDDGAEVYLAHTV